MYSMLHFKKLETRWWMHADFHFDMAKDDPFDASR